MHPLVASCRGLFLSLESREKVTFAAYTRSIDFPAHDISLRRSLTARVLHARVTYRMAVFSISASERKRSEEEGEREREKDGERVERKETKRMIAGWESKGEKRGNVFRVRATAYGFIRVGRVYTRGLLKAHR